MPPPLMMRVRWLNQGSSTNFCSTLSLIRSPLSLTAALPFSPAILPKPPLLLLLSSSPSPSPSPLPSSSSSPTSIAVSFPRRIHSSSSFCAHQSLGRTSWDEAADSFFSPKDEDKDEEEEETEEWRNGRRAPLKHRATDNSRPPGGDFRVSPKSRSSSSTLGLRGGAQSTYRGGKEGNGRWTNGTVRKTGSYGRSYPGGMAAKREGRYETQRIDRREMDGKSEYNGRSSSDRQEWKRPNPLPELRGQVIYGVGPIKAALQARRRDFYTLFVQEGMQEGGRRKDKAGLLWVLKAANQGGVTVKELSKHDLNLLTENRPHQGLVLDASPLELVLIDCLEPPPRTEEGGKSSPVWVALDEVQDPQNLGAILRSAYFLGALGVVVCAKNSAPLSGVVSKASAGALEVMEVRACRNMVKFLDKCSEKGWKTIGASNDPRAEPIHTLPRGTPAILVLGSEGKGLRTNVKLACETLVRIPGISANSQVTMVDSDEDEAEYDYSNNGETETLKMEGEEFVAVESLNVSVAAGILLHELTTLHSAV